VRTGFANPKKTTAPLPLQRVDSASSGTSLKPSSGRSQLLGTGRTEELKQVLVGYQYFFIWVLMATVPSFIVILLIPLDKSFGKKE
jgi:hypothetical protein